MQSAKSVGPVALHCVQIQVAKETGLPLNSSEAAQKEEEEKAEAKEAEEEEAERFDALRLGKKCQKRGRAGAFC